MPKKGGVAAPQKISLRFFRKFWGGKNNEFSEKGGGGHANPNEFRCKFLGVPKKAQHCFPKIWWGGSEAVWKFSENSLILVGVIVPKHHIFFWKVMHRVRGQFILCKNINFPQCEIIWAAR